MSLKNYILNLFVKKPIGVPKFEGYFSTEENMDKEQKSFYKYLEKELSSGHYIDVEGNISYLFVFLYKVLENWKKRKFNNLSEYLIYLSEIYKHETKVADYCLFWAYDCLLGLERYEEYLEKTEPIKMTGITTHASNLRLNVQKKIGVKANPLDLLLMAGGRKTKFITNNEALYKEKIIEVFNSYADENGEWFVRFQEWIPDSKLYPHSLFQGAIISQNPNLSFEIEGFYTSTEYIETIKSLSKEAENNARDIVGVPKIGEGWVSETELFRKIEAEFLTTKVLQHGKPEWLGRQHFDIWMPNWKIAIEYQGIQHYEPVEFFGGEEGFKKTVERDKKKMNLSKRHGVKLFLIGETDDQDELIKNIYDLVKDRKIIIPSV